MNPLQAASRRDFLKTASALGAGLSLGQAVHAAGSDTLRVGLIGCGGRGTGAAVQALSADKNTKLVAMGDMFGDRLQSSLATLKKEEGIGARVEVKPETCFTGFDAYKQVIEGVDVVLLASPPHFRPLHIRAAVEAGKHIFAEKPVAVDAPGVRSVLDSCQAAKKKSLSIVSGLCWRYHPSMRETFARIHDGAIGDIVAMQCSYNTGLLWSRPRQPEWTDMEWQLRNWLYFTWLSGDFITEQHIHSLDKLGWAMKNEYPERAIGMGGRQVRTDPQFGHVYDHFSVVYQWANGVKGFSNCRQMRGCANDVSDHIMGTKGTADVMRFAINGPNKWQYKGKGGNMYQVEHDELFASIRAGKPINDGEWMTKSTLMAIMGRMAAYTGQVVTWDQAFQSKEDLTPPKYAFGPLPTPPVATPGVTKFS